MKPYHSSRAAIAGLGRRLSSHTHANYRIRDAGHPAQAMQHKAIKGG